MVSQVDQHFDYGDTVQCRIHHQQAAIIEGQTSGASNVNLHCGHAALAPTELCRDDAEPNSINYCVFLEAFCPELLEEGQDCRRAVDALVADGWYQEAGFLSFTDTDINSLGCLKYWIMETPHDPSACVKADFDPDNWMVFEGGGVCQRP